MTKSTGTLAQTIATINERGGYFAGGALCAECLALVHTATQDEACLYALEEWATRDGARILCGRCTVPGTAERAYAVVEYRLIPKAEEEEEEATEESADVDYIVCEECAPYVVGGAALEDHAAYYGAEDETHRNLSTFIDDHGMMTHGGPVDLGGYYDCEACCMVSIGDAQRVCLID